MDNWFGEHIKMLRNSRRLTQTEIADLVGTSQTHYSNIEKGKVSPSMKLAERILNCFGFEFGVSVKRDIK